MILLGIALVAISNPSLAKPKKAKTAAVNCPSGQKNSLLSPSMCEPVASDEAKLMRAAKLEEAPIKSPKGDGAIDRYTACRITSDCGPGLFCTPSGYCAKSPADPSPISP